MLDRLYFISQQTDTKSHIDSIREALEAGCRLVQLRIKNQDEDDVLRQAIIAKELCDTYKARLIINDFPQVAKSVSAYGIHVGLQDMPIQEVRAIVGDDMIIGGTANTVEHVMQRVEEGADYIGLGPYRFTTTKEKLSPILGLEGYQRMLQQLRAANIQIPVVAIGGILPEDVSGLLQAGVHTIAMSGAITNAVNKRAIVEQFEIISNVELKNVEY
jgi:thiamine-phosphate pyrophosphorylase